MSVGGGTKSSYKKEDTKESEVKDESGTKTERLILDQTAIDKMVEDILGGSSGLASIFSGEKSAGLYNTSAAADASGNLIAKITGELAKITGVQQTDFETESARNRRNIVRTTEHSAEANASYGFGIK